MQSTIISSTRERVCTLRSGPGCTEREIGRARGYMHLNLISGARGSGDTLCRRKPAVGTGARESTGLGYACNESTPGCERPWTRQPGKPESAEVNYRFGPRLAALAVESTRGAELAITIQRREVCTSSWLQLLQLSAHVIRARALRQTLAFSLPISPDPPSPFRP